MPNLRSITLVLAIGGCVAEAPPKPVPGGVDTVVANASLRSIPSDASNRVIQDSVRDTLDGNRAAVTVPDDTLVDVGGGIIDDVYWLGHYQGKSAQYVRIQITNGYKPGGKPIWLTRATVLIPPMDSTEHLMFSGLCGIDYKSDPYVFAVVGIGGDSVYRNIRHAWRFERASETIQPIPTTNVVCWSPEGD